MPEGHLIHRVARDHAKLFGGQRLGVSSPQGRFAHEATLIDGKQLDDIDAHGKHLLYRWHNGPALHVHLGLYGKFRVHRKPPSELPEPRGQVRVRIVGPTAAFDLNGPNRCELLDDSEVAALVARLGDDPLRPDADSSRVARRVRSSKSAIGKLLLDQSVYAGVGNIYRSEVLHLLGIHPERTGREISTEECHAIWQKLVELMAIGVRYNRIIIADPKDFGTTYPRMKRHERLLVYKKAVCGNCGGPVRQWPLAARKVFACERCQI